MQREQLRTVPDALKTVPGLDVVQTGGPGGQTSVFMRGTNANHVKVLIDGIDVGNPSITNGAFDFAHLLTEDIESIEVLRGPQSGLYGSDAIGGVISITTKKGEGPPKVNATRGSAARSAHSTKPSRCAARRRTSTTRSTSCISARLSTPVTPLSLLAPGRKAKQRQLRQLDLFDQARRRSHRQFRGQSGRRATPTQSSALPATTAAIYPLD